MKTRHRTIVVALIALCAMSVCLLFVVRRWSALYRVTVLPSLGGAKTVAMAVNDRGQVVGVGQAKDGQWHAFLWDREHGLQDLGVAKGQFDINNAGQIVGSAPDPNGDPQAFLWERGKGRTPLGTLGGKVSEARAINNRGQVIGVSETSNGARHTFLWDSAQGMRDLATLGGSAINDAGQIAGTTSDPNGRGRVLFLWDPNEGLIATGLSPSDFPPLNGINSGSWVVGVMTPPKQGSRLVLWRQGAGARELFPLKYPLENFMPEPTLLNDANQVVFCEEKAIRLPILRRFFPPRNRHYLWDPNHGRILLDPYVLARVKGYFRPMDINNKGGIVGIVIYGVKGSPRTRAVLLEPIPERWGR